ncbi:MAG: molybdopterin molybdotransferase MoeA, partial [Alphaproteobacteria bacterium]|nr:molybdopterin molybdotransferase MoeA [Alphaproteobacteria bacterium]
MNDKPLLSVDEARSRILASAGKERPTETIALEQAIGRTLARDLTALRTQPPTDMSAMDGYALRTQDLAQGLVKLREIGVSTAGHGFAGSVGPGEAVRIFTGAPVPPGADAVLVQENARTENGVVEPFKPVATGRNIRLKGVDFSEGDPLLRAGARLNAASLALAAAMNHAHVTVTRRPRVAVLATGDELVRPGEPIGPNQIVATNSYAVAALVEAAGGEPQDLGIAKDELGALERAILTAREAACDLLVTLGGASVGDYDLVQPALAKQGIELDFWK